MRVTHYTLVNSQMHLRKFACMCARPRAHVCKRGMLQ